MCASSARSEGTQKSQTGVPYTMDDTIDYSIVFAKTAKGAAEINTRSGALSMQARRVLIMIDGRRPVAHLGVACASRLLLGVRPISIRFDVIRISTESALPRAVSLRASHVQV